MINHVAATYCSNKLFEHIKQKHKLTSDSQLARFLFSSSPTISRIMNGRLGLTPKMVLIIYDRTGMPIDQIRSLFKQKVASNEGL
jgi:plasmid maintenance system antidote protein VapI